MTKSKKQFIKGGGTHIINTLTGEEYYAPCEWGLLELLNNQQDEIQQLKEKLQISEASFALLVDMILLGDVDELIRRTRECARQVAEQFDKLTKEELEDAVKGNARLRELFNDE